MIIKKNRVTIADIARVANVSSAAVSVALSGVKSRIMVSEETRERIHKIAKDMGYQPSAAGKALKTGRSQAIVVAVMETMGRDQSFTQRLRGIIDALTPKDYYIYTFRLESNSVDDDYASFLKSGRADGVLITGYAGPRTYPALKKIHDVAKEAGLPVVPLANAWPREMVQLIIDIDDVSGGYQATKHLIDHGHSRIAFVGVKHQPWAERREEGYIKALMEAGISVDEQLIIRLDDPDQTETYDRVTELTKTRQFTAIFGVSDFITISAVAALKTQGKRIPQDCAVVSHDDDPVYPPYFDPPLTTVHNPFYESAKAAAESLMDIIEGRPVTRQMLPVKLVVRESCGCKPQG